MKAFSLVVTCTALAALVPNLAAQPAALNVTPSRVIGHLQTDLTTANPNLLEGREFYFPQSVAVDRNSATQHVYVSDTGNHRVLGWRDATAFANGATADIVIGQVDKRSSFQLGPGTQRTTGLRSPTGLALDVLGNVYVFDAGNNRVIRYPRPFESLEDVKAADMVIGQPSFNSREANAGGLSAKTLSTAASNTVLNGQIAIDSAGNLWVSDSGNNRVLRFPKRVLDEGRNGPDADLVLGQTDFTTGTGLTDSDESRQNRGRFRAPSGLGVDTKGRVFVGDILQRVLVFFPNNGNFTNGQTASRIMGIFLVTPGDPPPAVNPYVMVQPEGIAMHGDMALIADRSLNRVLKFDPVEQWPPENQQTQISPPARMVYGQTNMNEARPNQGGDPSPRTLRAPTASAVGNTDLFIVDTLNHRVLVYPNLGEGSSATRVLGQDVLEAGGANLVEGRELNVYFPGQFPADSGGIAIDQSAETPHLYIADTYNHRVLGFRDARRVKPGDKADIVIGQVDFRRATPNSPANDSGVQNATGLLLPSGLAVDAGGNLWVADSGNSRVLRFPAPFAANWTEGQHLTADVVLGQISFTSRTTDASSRTMARPHGLAFTSDGQLAVSDTAHNRVLLFRAGQGSDFASGQAASLVIGQSDFNTGTRGSGSTRLGSPHHIAIDSEDRLYVADTLNSRVAMYERISNPALGNDPTPTFSLGGLNNPHAVSVSRTTGEIWVTSWNQDRVFRYPQYSNLILNPRSDFQVQAFTPLAVTQGSTGNLYVVEGVNRVGIFFPALVPANTASGNDEAPLAPGMVASLYPGSAGLRFGDQTADYTSINPIYPVTKELGGLEVLVNEEPAPLFYVSPTQINFIVPSTTPTSGTATYLVVRKATGEVLAAGTVNMAESAPALFSVNQTGSGQVAAVNEDGKVNSASDPVPWNQVIQLFGTGPGPIPNAPEDGTPASGAISTTGSIRVIVGFEYVPQTNILYSGVAPGLPGVWQVNVRIPNTVVPGNTVPIVVVYNGRSSNRGKGDDAIQTTIAVKQ